MSHKSFFVANLYWGPLKKKDKSSIFEKVKILFNTKSEILISEGNLEATTVQQRTAAKRRPGSKQSNISQVPEILAEMVV